MFYHPNDPIGFNPTGNQAEQGTPRTSGWGNAARSRSPLSYTDYFPTYPYRGRQQFTGRQFFAVPNPPVLYGATSLYRGIAPVTLQPIVQRPYPYQRGR